MRRAFYSTIFVLGCVLASYVNAAESLPFQGRITQDGINVRTDSTVGAEVICTVSKGDSVTVVSESYDWCKVRLPRSAPSYVRKDLVAVIDDKTAKVDADNVNVRLSPAESSAIVGRVSRNEVVGIIAESGNWYRIQPVSNSFGWVHKKFVRRLSAEEASSEQSKEAQEARKIREVISTPQETLITVEGEVRPKTVKTIATHKLICEDRKVYLLLADTETLNALNRRRAKITGKILDPESPGPPIIEVVSVEALD